MSFTRRVFLERIAQIGGAPAAKPSMGGFAIPELVEHVGDGRGRDSTPHNAFFTIKLRLIPA